MSSTSACSACIWRRWRKVIYCVLILTSQGDLMDVTDDLMPCGLPSRPGSGPHRHRISEVQSLGRGCPVLARDHGDPFTCQLTPHVRIRIMPTTQENARVRSVLFLSLFVIVFTIDHWYGELHTFYTAFHHCGTDVYSPTHLLVP
jgi:hypothetical protein